MRPKTLLLLTVTVLVLGAFIFFYEKDLPSTDERAELAKKVLRIEEDEVESLLVQWGDNELRLERQRPASGDGTGEDASVAASNDGWRITSPFVARADRGAVDALVSALADLESSRSFEGFDHVELGLDEPRARVTVAGSGGQSVLEVGAEVPASNDMVVAVTGGTKAYRVASDLLENLTREPGDWRDKNIFTGLRGDVERLSLETRGKKVLLARRGNVAPEGSQRNVAPQGGQRNTFWIESPVTDRADEDQVNSLLSELTSLRAESFVDEPLLTPEGMGLEPPWGIVEVMLEGLAEPFRLELGHATGAEGGAVYGRADDQLFEVETGLVESLAIAGADWRSKTWTALQVFKIESARLEDAEGALEVSRDGADWKRGEDRIGYAVVSDLLYPITEARGERVVERAEAIAAGHELAQPSLQMTLSTEDGTEELELFPAVGGVAAAVSAGRDAVLLLAEEQAVEILDQLKELRTAEALPAEGEESKVPEDAEPVE